METQEGNTLRLCRFRTEREVRKRVSGYQRSLGVPKHAWEEKYVLGSKEKSISSMKSMS